MSPRSHLTKFGDPSRTKVSAVLDTRLVEDLEREATARGVPVERLVEEVLAQSLPGALAEAAEAYVRQSMRLAGREQVARDARRALEREGRNLGEGAPQ